MNKSEIVRSLTEQRAAPLRERIEELRQLQTGSVEEVRQMLEPVMEEMTGLLSATEKQASNLSDAFVQAQEKASMSWRMASQTWSQNVPFLQQNLSQISHAMEDTSNQVKKLKKTMRLVLILLILGALAVGWRETMMLQTMKAAWISRAIDQIEVHVGRPLTNQERESWRALLR